MKYVYLLWAEEFILVQFSSVARLCLTLCDPMNCSGPGLPIQYQLPEFTQTHVWVSDAIQPSHPLSFPFPPAPNPSQHQSPFQWVNSWKYKSNLQWGEKARDFQKNTYFCFIDYTKAFDCVDHNKLWKILKEMGIRDGNTRPPDLPPEKSVCRSRSNS